MTNRQPISAGSYKTFSNRVRTALGKSVEGFIEAGKHLEDARSKLTPDGYKKLLEDLHMHEGTARKLRAIGAHERQLRAHAHALPPNWTPLYELTQLPEDQLSQAVESGSITPETDRKAIKKYVESASQPAGQSGGGQGSQSQQSNSGSQSDSQNSDPFAGLGGGGGSTESQGDSSADSVGSDEPPAPPWQGLVDDVEPDLKEIERLANRMAKRLGLKANGQGDRDPYAYFMEYMGTIRPIKDGVKAVRQNFPAEETESYPYYITRAESELRERVQS